MPKRRKLSHLSDSDRCESFLRFGTPLFYAIRITWRGGLPRGGPTPSWKHRETTQELGEFIRLRQTCGVGTIVEPLWSHAGTLCCHMVSSCLRRRNHRTTIASYLRRRNHRGAMQEPCVFIWFRPACDVGTIVEPSRNLVTSYEFVLLATSEPSWNHRGTTQEPCDVIWVRHTCDVGTIVESSWNLVTFVILATSVPAWNHRGTMQEPCDFIWLRRTCDVGTIVEPSWNQAGTL